ncbi:LacI family DNA-binding transcriptional regulator [Paenibacillus hamazuiensis]|uniref:LacI family DNA-binding transcriptional regulator n=1 Tax=Paenibacillus hamazuiensis TaxID=2936508 RepID=UPI00200FBF7A|nr:LacI family DNA-binding transcriptional regulator [Paenibacillus hamazuiensis]
MVTRKEVAERAGVSVAVVSYVFGGRQIVKESTRQKVLQAAKELGYQPNPIARSLKTKRSQQLAVLVNHLGNPFESGILLGLERRAREAGYFLFVQTYAEQLEEELKALLTRRADGIILLGQNLKRSTVSHFSALGVPIVSVTTPVASNAAVPALDIDWTAAFMKLVRHLKEGGHNRIGFMGSESPSHHHAYRCGAFIRAVRREGLEFDPLRQLIYAQGTYETGYAAMLERLSSPHALPYTALVCANDLMAVGALAACRQQDLRVPEQLAVAGCENILMSSQTAPALTVMDYPRSLMAPVAVERLLGMLDGKPGESLLMEAELLVRESTGKTSRAE